MRFACIVLALALAGVLSAQNVFTVTNISDSGAGSLRQAINDANATTNQVVSMVPVADEIRFQAGVTGTITLASALPVISEGVSVIGPGRSLLTISGANTLRIFESGLGHFLGVSRMTLTSGFSTGDGGAIFCRGLTSINDVAFVNCNATAPNSGGGPGGTARGGAIFHTPAIALLSVINSVFQNCIATGGNGLTAGGNGIGGAVYVAFGSASFLQVTFDGCQAQGGSATSSGNGGFGRGGAVSSDVDLSLVDCVLDTCAATGGLSVGSGTGGAGFCGGTYCSGSLTMTNCSVVSCTANGASSPGASGTGGNGEAGGVGCFGNSGKATTLTKVSISDCLATRGGAAGGTAGTAQGGGISAAGAFTMVESEVSNCGSGTVERGGGVRFESSENMSIQRSTIAGCTGTGLVVVNSALAAVINCTISGNNGGSGIGTGGLESSNASVQVSFSTITGNVAAIYGGVYKVTGTLTVIASIIAGNSGSAGSQDLDANGSMSIQNSVVGIQDPDAIAVNGVNGNQVGTSASPLNAQLASLLNNGGPTRTHALGSTSPAINMGGSTGVPGTDQRNAPRNQGAADVGSYEFGATPPNTGGTAGGEGDARCSTGPDNGTPWLALLGLIAALGLALRRARVQ